jgi:hypothetical protein
METTSLDFNRFFFGVTGAFIGALTAMAMCFWLFELNWDFVGYGAGAGFVVYFFGEQAIDWLTSLFRAIW